MNRSVEQNLDLFERMKAGEFEEGAHVLRARIDMASGNINLRDPTLYRIRRAPHVRTGTTWSIYPMYDYTHCLSDAYEGVTHSLCTLEFEDHRPLYDWVLDALETPCHPQQIEFARLQLEYAILSKRKLIALVENGHVDGWDDPRMPTLVGMRRRGCTPASIRTFCERIGVTKSDAWIDMGVLEGCVRDDLNESAPRRLAVLDPLKVDDHRRCPRITTSRWSSRTTRRTSPSARARCASGATLYVEREDFAEDPPPKWQRLVEGGEVRLRGSYVVRCDELVRDAEGRVVELRCSHDPDTLGRKPEGRKVKGVIHWVSAAHGVRATVRAYDRLFTDPRPDRAEDVADVLNPDSVTVHDGAIVEPIVASVASRRRGCSSSGSATSWPTATSTRRIVRRSTATVTLRDTWAR